MCCTCDANRLIEAHAEGQTVIFDWDDVPEVVLEVEAIGDEAEGAPAKVRLRKGQEGWSAWFDTNDLATTMLRLGTDVKWPWVRKEIKAWLTGSGELDLSLLEAP